MAAISWRLTEATVEEVPGSDMPRASMALDMVLAVNMPPLEHSANKSEERNSARTGAGQRARAHHAPEPGMEQHSISCSSSSSIRPAASAPAAS